LDRTLEPVELLAIHVVRIEDEKLDVALRERIKALTVHVERFVEALVGIVVVAERGVELDAGIEQRLVRHLELLLKVLWSLSAVDVVANHDRKREVEALPVLLESPADLVLRLVAGAGVANHGEAR